MLQCEICLDEVQDIDSAIDNGWIPSFWDHNSETTEFGPCCGACFEAYIEKGPESLGEFQLTVSASDLGLEKQP